MKPVIDSRPMRNLALIGFMGTGKSTVGRLVARALHFELVDTDRLIEEREGKRVSEIFEEKGEAAFRELERDTVRELEARENIVIATGGGLPAHHDNLAHLKTHALVVCLWASPETIWTRVRHHTHRPLLQAPDPQARIAELLLTREKYYRQADILVNTDNRHLQEVAQNILHHFQLARGSRQ